MLPRPQLAEKLWAAVRQRKLTLLSAPAGAGKTMAVANLHHLHPEQTMSWITLDEEDNDPLTFMTITVAALRQAVPDFGAELSSLLETGAAVRVSLRRLMALLINEILLAGTDPFLLVLDDLHQIKESSIYEALDYLLDHQPANFHLVVTTRTDPPLSLARLRMRAELAEFRLPELRFDSAETARYLNDKWKLALSEADLKNLYAQTEGWIASVHLLAGRLAELSAAERAKFVNRFSRSNRLIFDLLAEEVLAQQPADLRRFLLETSILRELTPTLCTAITQNPHASELLDRAYRRNLFLVALEEATAQETPYRYHALFGAFLQKRLVQERPDDWSILHRRAAEAEKFPERAIDYYLAAEMWPEAAAALVELGRGDVIRRFVRAAVIDDILRLPEKIWQENPWLRLILGVFHAQRGESERSGQHLDQALALFQAHEDELGVIEVLVAECWRLGGVMNQTILEQLAAKIEAAPDLFRPDQLAGYHAAAQWAFEQSYRWDRVTYHLNAGLELAQRTGDLGAIMTVGGAFGPELLFVDGGPGPAEIFALTVLKRDDLPYSVRMFTQAILAYIRFYQARPMEADDLLVPVEQFLDNIGGYIWVDGHVAWLRLSLAQINIGGPAWSAAFQEAVTRMAANPVNAAFLPGLYYMEGRAAFAQNRPDLLKTAQQKVEAAASNSYFPDDESVRLLILKGLLALSNEAYETAAAALREAVQRHRIIRQTTLLHDPRLALALIYFRQGNSQTAFKELAIALADWRERGLPGVVLQEGLPILTLLEAALTEGIEAEMLPSLIKILRQASSPRPVPIPDSTELLSPREMEVLRLLATGASNRDIAAELVVTVRTVKAHVSSILGKLGVSSRTQAVARARDLRLI